MYKKITVMGKFNQEVLMYIEKWLVHLLLWGKDGFNSFSVNGILGFSTLKTGQHASNANAVGNNGLQKLILNSENPLYFI